MEYEIRPIPGFPGYYVSENGEVYGPQRGFSQPLTKKEDHGGYHYVHIHNANNNSKNKYLKVHRIVATAFIENPENKRQVNHKNGDKHNNNVENLEWVTCKENFEHAKITGLTAKGDRHASKTSKLWLESHVGGEKHYWASLTNKEAERIRKIHKRVRNHRGLNIKLAKKFNVKIWTIESILYGRTYASI